MLKLSAWSTILTLCTLLPKLGCFGVDFAACGAKPLYNIGIASIAYRGADLVAMLFIGCVAKSAFSPVAVYRQFTKCWTCAKLCVFFAGVCYATAAVSNT